MRLRGAKKSLAQFVPNTHSLLHPMLFCDKRLIKNHGNIHN
jgi:hypothetical protein